MTPMDVAADAGLQERFFEAYAHRDGATRTLREAELARSPLTLTTIAWLWPDRTYSSDFNPFDRADERNSLDAGRWREWLAAEFKHVLVVAGQASEHDVGDLLGYLAWTLHIGRSELARIVDGYYHVEWAQQVCAALQLEFRNGWVLREPELLGRRVDQSKLASRISDHLRHLTVENLGNLIKHKKLPQGVDEPERSREPEVYEAPVPGNRYRALYEVLANDKRDNPTYSPAGLSRRIEAAGGTPLPMDATADDTWWIKADTNPSQYGQAAAWRAAGYRVARKQGVLVSRFRPSEVTLADGKRVHVQKHVDPEDDAADVSTEVLEVRLQALPGRRGWLADPARVNKGIYRMPTEVQVPLRLTKVAGEPLDLLHDGAVSTPLPRPGPTSAMAKDIRELVDRLVAAGEADAATVKGFFPDLEPDEFAKLLARARRAREPKVRNYGSRTRPRWVAVGSKGDHLIPIARELWFRGSADPVPHVGPGAGLPEWFTQLVEATVGGGQPIGADEGELAYEARAVNSALADVAEALKRVGESDSSDTLKLLERLRHAVDDLATVRLMTEPAETGREAE